MSLETPTPQDPTPEPTPSTPPPAIESNPSPPLGMPSFEIDEAIDGMEPSPPSSTPETPTAEAPPEAPPETPEAPPEVPPSTLRERLVEAGYESAAAYKSDDELLPYIQELMSRDQELQQNSHLFAAGQEYLQHKDKFQEYLQSQQAAAPPEPEQTPQDESSWQVPEYNEKWEQLCEFNADLGRYTVRNDYRQHVAPAVAEKLTEYKIWEADAARKITREFPTLVREEAKRLFEEFKQELPTQMEQFTAEQQQQAEADAFAREHKDEFYVCESDGSVRIAPNGYPVLSPRGRVMVQYLEQGAAMGIQNESALRQYGLQQLELLDLKNGNGKPPAETPPAQSTQVSEQPATPTESPSERAARVKSDYLRSAIEQRKQSLHAPNSDATVAAAAAAERSQNESLDFGQMLEQDLQQEGLSVNDLTV